MAKRTARLKPPPRRRTSPLVEKLAALKGDDSIIELHGYLGDGPEGRTRLYMSLALEQLVDIPDADVLHVEEGKDERGRVSVFVRGSAEIRATSTRTTTMPAASFALSQNVGTFGSSGFIIGPWLPPRIPPRFFDCLWICSHAYQRCLETNPFLEKIPTVCDDQFAGCMKRCLSQGGGSIAI